jgi:hypothetical protein
VALGDVRSGRVAPRWLSLLAASLVGVVAIATGAASAEEPPAADERAGPSELAPSGAVVERRTRDLSPEDKLEDGKQMVAAIQQMSQSIQRQLQSAKKDRDVVRVLCLNDKLNQVDVALRSGQDRLGALEAAAERKDADRCLHEYTVLVVLNDHARVLNGEASQCVGEETGFVGEAEVSVSIDPNLPDGDTGFVADPNAIPPPPNISSPIE